MPDTPDSESRRPARTPNDDPGAERAQLVSDEVFDDVLVSVLEEHADALRRLTT